MKKFLAILVVMALLLSATACGKSKGDDAGKADVQTGDSVQTEQTAAPVADRSNAITTKIAKNFFICFFLSYQ